MNDSVDKLVIFLAKRDGIDKLVKTFQYVSKLLHWRLDSRGLSRAASHAKSCETASGLSRKAFRLGRSLTGFNALRRSPGPTPTMRLLSVLASGGEMVYFLFDHALWLSRAGAVSASVARPASFVSAFGEAFGYCFFVVADAILIGQGIAAERKLLLLRGKDGDGDEEKVIGKIRAERVMRMMAVAANVADLIIAMAEIEPNRFCNHVLTLGISGLVSAWAGWYRNWPS